MSAIKITKCSGYKCPMTEHCGRYTDKIEGEVIAAPFKIVDGIFRCPMFCGKQQDGILNQLKDIVHGRHN